MNTLDEFAEALASLEEVTTDAARAVAPIIEERTRAAGRDGGPLRKGNAVAASARANGSSVEITGVFPYGPREFPREFEEAVDAELRKRLGEGDG